jgi:hypothetical protein
MENDHKFTKSKWYHHPGLIKVRQKIMQHLSKEVPCELPEKKHILNN